MFWKTLFTHQFIKDALLSAVFITSVYGITHNPVVRPTPIPETGNWSVQFMQHPLLFGFAGHNYLALRDEQGTIVSELHGLATDMSQGSWKYIGTSPKDVLQVWEFENGKYYLAGKTFPGIVLKQGDEGSVLELWEKALACKEPINEKNIPYPPYGVRFRNETINSNSVAYTLARCMGLDTRHIGIWTPGSGRDLLNR